RGSEHIDSDAVFAVKPSLLRELTARSADDPERPPGITGAWWSLARDFVLVPAGPAAEPPAAMPASHPRSCPPRSAPAVIVKIRGRRRGLSICGSPHSRKV